MRTFQTSPEPAEFFRRFDDTVQVINFLWTAKATRSAAIGEFAFPQGRMRVEGFSDGDVLRIGDWFRIIELGREVGYANPPRAAVGVRSFSNPLLPFIFLVISAIPLIAITVLSLAGLLPTLGGIWIAGACILPIIVLGIALSGRRLRWYSRVRARVAETGERMPYGLGLVD